MIKNIIETVSALTVQLEGRLDTVASRQFEEELDEIVANLSGRSLVLDAKDLTYISSMGLRILFKLRRVVNYKLVNVTQEIYSVIEMVGFDKILDIERALRNIDVEGCEVIGRGINGTVYRLDGDLIAKIYNEKIPLEMITKEHDYAQAAFLSGIPTAISYDTVKCGNRFGIVFEMLEAQTFAEKLHGHPETFDHYARIYANILKQMHATKADTDALPSAADKYHSWIDQLAHIYTEEERTLMHNMIDALPARDTTIHGDFHPKNIMLQGEEPMLIDMADVCYGHPMFDFACTTLTHRYYPSIQGDKVLFFVGINYEEMERLWWIFLEVYFETTDRARLEEIDNFLIYYGILRYGLQPALIPQTPEEDIKLTVKTLREKLFPFAKDIVGKVFF